VSETKITVRNNGPLLVSGPVTLEDAAGQAFGLSGRTTIGLCRCGASENKPFCDGAHNRAGFKSEVAARVLPPPAPKP
jgi:CDGSH-type Zn-finger protein